MHCSSSDKSNKLKGVLLQSLLHSLLFALLVFTVVGLLLLSVGSAARRELIAAAARRRWLVRITAGLLGWLGITAALGLSGLLAAWTAIPPRVLMLPVTYLTVLVSLSFTRSFQQLLAALPLWPLVAVQSYRIAVEILLWLFHQDGRVPIQMTFEGRNLDLLVGVTAPLVAMGVYRQWIGPRGCIVWNLSGMGILLNTIATAATSVPGPLQLDWPGEPFVAIATWPLVWLPAFLAPTALYLHILSIRQALRLGSAGA